MTTFTPILETYVQQLLQPLQTFQTSSDMKSNYVSDSSQSLAPSVPHHNEFQPMTTQQTEAMAHATLINFFGTSRTVSSILQMVQQNLTEFQPDQNQVTISDHLEGTSFSTSIEHNNSQNTTYTI